MFQGGQPVRQTQVSDSSFLFPQFQRAVDRAARVDGDDVELLVGAQRVAFEGNHPLLVGNQIDQHRRRIGEEIEIRKLRLFPVATITVAITFRCIFSSIF